MAARRLFVVVILAACAVADQVGVSPAGKATHSKKAKRKKKLPGHKLLIGVDRVDDPIDSTSWTPGSGQPLPRTKDMACTTQAVPYTTAFGPYVFLDSDAKCTLRAALEMAQGLGGGGNDIVIRMRAGRFRLSAPLPEVLNPVSLIGSIGRNIGSPKKKRRSKRTIAPPDADDNADPYYEDKGGHQLLPIGTTLDGDERWQILRAGYNSRLFVSSVRFENGRAVDSTGHDPRWELGGALNTLGYTTLNNTVFAGNRAINGGGTYVEGRLEIHHSVLQGNSADRCGGFIYTAGQANITNSALRANVCGHFDCRKVDDSGKPGEPLPTWRTRALPGADADDDDDDDDAMRGVAVAPVDQGWRRTEDASGAVAEGPPLTKLAFASLGAADALDRPKLAGGTPSKKKIKGAKLRASLSASDSDELHQLSASVDEEMEVEAREREELAAEEARQRRLEEADAVHSSFRLASMMNGGGPQATAPSAQLAAPGKVCDPEKHGGEGGVIHELHCGSGLWRTGRKMATECVQWQATANCSSDGERQPSDDLSCFEFVPPNVAGYCQCAGGVRVGHSTCEHEPFTCQAACRAARESRRRLKWRKRREEGLATDGLPTVPPKLYAVGAYGSSSGGLVNGIGLICSDGSRTALAGSQPDAPEHAWEFVCPGWPICRDSHSEWDTVTKRPLCAAWAAQGECTRNEAYMREECARSCNACTDLVPPAPSAALGLSTLDVRGGILVDAVRFHCGSAAAAEAAAEATAEAAVAGEGALDGATEQVEANGGGPTTPASEEEEEDWGLESLLQEDSSVWFGGKGGDECSLHCGGGGKREADGSGQGDGSMVERMPSYRVGGVIETLTVSSGQRVDRLELTKCTKDLEI